MAKIIISLPSDDIDFNYSALIEDIDAYLHRRLGSGDCKYEIYRLN
jgi:hypothetical protein